MDTWVKGIANLWTSTADLADVTVMKLRLFRGPFGFQLFVLKRWFFAEAVARVGGGAVPCAAP